MILLLVVCCWLFVKNTRPQIIDNLPILAAYLKARRGMGSRPEGVTSKLKA